jgi:hypothetical protein
MCCDFFTFQLTIEENTGDVNIVLSLVWAYYLGNFRRGRYVIVGATIDLMESRLFITLLEAQVIFVGSLLRDPPNVLTFCFEHISHREIGLTIAHS